MVGLRVVCEGCIVKAAQLYEVGKDLRIVDVPVPEVGPGDVLVRIRASGLCHSDIHYRDGVSPVGRLPIILGHEIAGVVERVGAEVDGVKPGDRVCIHYQLSCGDCIYCTTGREYLCDRGAMIGKHVDGGFAEYISVPARNVLKIPEGIPFEQAAIIGCAVSTPFHALRIADLRPGEAVAVYGVGGIGIHAVQLASKVFNASPVIAIDLVEEKLQLARRLGADETINAGEVDPVDAISEITDGRMVDVAVEAVGLAKTAEQTVRSVGKAGRSVFIGIGGETIKIQPYTQLITKEAKILGSSDHTKQEMQTILKLVKAGKIDLTHSITHWIHLEEINEAMQTLRKNIGNPIRIVIIQ
ncbi:MAG TPA: alcohol dehydrogenase [Candidatus Bathyarchaeota archaeon]|nr:alcohol dehydrogenase [Candidatus Bathyarchaeota archaeon]